MAAIDQLIAQGGGQQFDPLATVGRVTQLQNLRLQGQAAQTQNQTAQLENQQRQTQLNDQQAMTRAMQSWDGQDYNALPGLVMKSGGSATAVMGLKKSLIEQQQSLANLSKDQLANEKVKNDYFAQLIANVKQVPPEQQPQAFEAAKAQAAQRGLLSPQEAQQYQYQGPDQLDIIEKGLIGHSNALAMAEKQSTIAKNNAEAREKGTVVPADAVSAKVLNVPVGSPQPLAVVQKARESANVGMENVTSDGRVKVISRIDPNVQARDLGAAPAVTTFNLQNLNPQSQQFQNSVDLVGTGKVDLQTMLSRMPAPSRMSFVSELGQKYPQFAQYNYNAAKGTAESAAYGDIAKQAQAFNTTIAHFGLLNQTIDALGNGNVQALNKVSNAFKSQFGGTAPTNFNIVKQVAADEFAKAAAGMNVAQSDREKADGVLSAAQGPAQLKQAIAMGQELLKGKMDALNYTLQRGQNPGSNMPLASPQATSAMGTGAITVTDPRGVVHSFKDQASADNFKKLAGIK